MSANRSKDRSSLCSCMFVDCRHRPVSSRAQRRIRFRRRSGGLQTGSAMAASALVSSRAQPRDPLFAGCVQILHLAQHEYINAYGTNSWRETIRTSHEQSADHMSPDPESPTPEPEPEPEPATAPTPAAPSDASPASE